MEWALTLLDSGPEGSSYVIVSRKSGLLHCLPEGDLTRIAQEAGRIIGIIRDGGQGIVFIYHVVCSMSEELRNDAPVRSGVFVSWGDSEGCPTDTVLPRRGIRQASDVVERHDYITLVGNGFTADQNGLLAGRRHLVAP